MAHRRLAAVRERYKQTCGYCGVTEVDVGGELTVDHFIPTSAGGDDSDENLVYACVRCNQYKGALVRAEASDEDLRLLHPLEDDSTEHILEDTKTGQLIGKSARGAFHISALRLNRHPLVQHRIQKQLLTLVAARVGALDRENATLGARLSRLELYVAMLQERLEVRVETDPP